MVDRSIIGTDIQFMPDEEVIRILDNTNEKAVYGWIANNMTQHNQFYERQGTTIIYPFANWHYSQ